jgi:hypothetical protein
MIGTITKRARQDGKLVWGYSFFAGRTSAGKRIQITKAASIPYQKGGDGCAAYGYRAASIGW